ncbi:GM12580 [Drosophila sechellia]|uniref:GM12580 n=1 Tax=Drosophila sechellia TaxID=7238 RepID=B4I0C4_DROSE|nr:GM12580 [Drosophila sechellia]
MASSNVSDWDEPLPTSTESLPEEEDPDVCAEENVKKRREEELDKLELYVKRMAYQPTLPPKVKPYDVALSKPKMHTLIDNYEQFKDVYDPKLRAKRIKRMLGKYNAITTEQLEQILKSNKTKERKKEDFLKRKQELYYNMLTKLERQCRTQYLNVLIKKFAKFISHLATTMRIPPQLVDPYARMQRGIFLQHPAGHRCAAHLTVGHLLHQPRCHRVRCVPSAAHPLLQFDYSRCGTSAALQGSQRAGQAQQNMDFEMDNHIKRRLMCAAEKKLVYERRRKKPQPQGLGAFEKCTRYDCD